MCEKLSKLWPRVLSASDGHKCRQRQCQLLAEDMQTMKTLIVFTNHLNNYYINKIKTFDDSLATNEELFRRQRHQLLAAIEAEVKTIRQNITNITSDRVVAKKSMKMRCDLCNKY